MIAWLAGLTLKATLVLLAAAAAAHASRRSPAATRHFVWMSGLALLLLMPILAVALPAWSPPWAAEWVPEYLVAERPGLSPESMPWPPSGAVDGGVRGLLLRPDSTERGDVLSKAPATGISVGPTAPLGSPGADGKAREASFDPTPWVLGAWVVGAALMVVWLAIGFLRRARLSRHAAVLDAGPIVDASDAAAKALGLRRSIRVLLGESRFVPMTWGVVRPVLYLPAAARGWGAPRLRAVLMHELAHIKRHDSLSRFLAQLACSVFWFHPLAWVSARRMLREQERACDDVVIVAGADPHHYAETLVEIAREFRSPRPHVVGALAFSRRSNLEHRLLSILDPLERRKKMSPFRKALVATLFLGAVLPLAALQPVDAAQQANQKQKPPPKVVKVAPRADVAVGVVVPRADAVATGVSVLAPRADVAVGVVVPRANAVATGVGVVVPRADGVSVGVVVPRLSSVATGIGVTVPQADAPPQVRIRIAEPGASVQLEARGAVNIPADVDAIELDADGWLVITERDRRLDVRPATDGALEFIYTKDGVEVAFDDPAREWANGVLERMAGVGNLRGNVFISGIADISSLSYEIAGLDTLELAFEPLRLMEGNLAVTLEQLKTAIEPLQITVEGLSPATEPLILSIEGLETSLEPLVLSMEGLKTDVGPLILSVEGLETTMEPLVLSMESLETALESLDTVVEPLELSIDHLNLAMEPLELALDAHLAGIGVRRFDRVQAWSEGGSRFAAMWRGAVDIGATVDGIEVGESGELVIDERSSDDGHRRLHVFADDTGAVTFEWYVDGEEVSFDDQGRAWLQPILDWLNEHEDMDPALS